MDRGAALRRLLDDAHAALADGDAADAERRAKAVSALIRAEGELTAYVATHAAPEEDEEAIRAEIRNRVARFVEAAGAGAPDEVLERIGRGQTPSG
jgi:predicted glycoside hydrolase/deacetylase ChbG (UPF0249 family)